MKKNKLEWVGHLYKDGRGLVAQNKDGGFVAACPAMIVYKGLSSLSVDDVTYSDGITLKSAIEVINKAESVETEPYNHNKVNDLCKAIRMPKERLKSYVGYLNDSYVIVDDMREQSELIGTAEGDGAVHNWIADALLFKKVKPDSPVRYSAEKGVLLYTYMYRGDEYRVIVGCLSVSALQEVRGYLIEEGVL